MNWADFIALLRKRGFVGSDDSLADVQSWLAKADMDDENVEGKDGTEYSLKELYESRPGRRLNVADAESEAEFTKRVRERVAAELDEIKTETGIAKKPGEVVKRHEHDITVGNDRVVYDAKGGFPHFGVMCQQVVQFGQNNKSFNGCAELERFQKAALGTYASEGIGGDGGFAVPTEYSDQIMVHVMGEDSVASRCDQYMLTRNGINLPSDETTPWGSSGIQASWEGEAAAIAQSKPVLKLKELRLRKLSALCPITEELMEDSTAMGAYVSKKAGQVLSFKLGEAIFRGTGAGQPFGYLNSSATVSVTKETSQVLSTVQSGNVFKMWSRLYGPYRRNAVWFVNQDIEPTLYTMAVASKDAAGNVTSGGGPVYIPPGGMSQAPYGTLLGRPVIPTQHCATVGQVGDIILADLSQYILAMKAGGVQSSTSLHFWFDQDTMALKFRIRADGQPWLDTTIAARDSSSPALSAFVTLAIRT